MTLFELEAILSLDTTSFDSGVSNATASGKSFAQQFRTNASEVQTFAQQIGADSQSIKTALSSAFSFSVANVMTDALKSILSGVKEFVSDSISVASDVEQTNEKIKAVFGDSANAVMNWSATTKTQFGIGAQSAKTYASQLAGIISTDSYGFNTEQIAEYSTAMVELAGDIASFQNMDVDIVWQKLLSGLRGETEAIETLGLDMRVGSLAEYFGMDDNDFSKLTGVEQWMYRYQFIMENTTVAQGDFVRTQDTYANQMRVFEENITELKAAIGETLLPVMNDLLHLANSLFGGGQSVEEVMDGLRDGFVDQYTSIDTTTDKALALVAALEKLEEQGGDTEEGQGVWNALLAELTGTLPGLSSIIDTTTGSITGGTDAIRDYVTAWQDAQRQLSYQDIMQQAYQKVAEQSAAVAQTEIQLAMYRDMQEQGVDESYYLAQAKEYLESTYDVKAEGYDLSYDMGIWSALNDAINAENDPVAEYYTLMMLSLDEIPDKIAELEKQLTQEKALLLVAENEYEQLERQANALLEATGGTAQGSNESATRLEQAAQTLIEAAAALASSLLGVEVNLDGEKVGELTSEYVKRDVVREMRTQFPNLWGR